MRATQPGRTVVARGRRCVSRGLTALASTFVPPPRVPPEGEYMSSSLGLFARLLLTLWGNATPMSAMIVRITVPRPPPPPLMASQPAPAPVPAVRTNTLFGAFGGLQLRCLAMFVRITLRNSSARGRAAALMLATTPFSGSGDTAGHRCQDACSPATKLVCTPVDPSCPFLVHTL